MEWTQVFDREDHFRVDMRIIPCEDTDNDRFVEIRKVFHSGVEGQPYHLYKTEGPFHSYCDAFNRVGTIFLREQNRKQS